MSVKAEVAPQQTNIKSKEVLRPEAQGARPLDPARLGEFKLAGTVGLRPTAERTPFGMRPQTEGVSTAERTVVYSVVKQGRDIDLGSPQHLQDADTPWKTSPQGAGKDPIVDST